MFESWSVLEKFLKVFFIRKNNRNKPAPLGRGRARAASSPFHTLIISNVVRLNPGWDLAFFGWIPLANLGHDLDLRQVRISGPL
jgi:hypothetical protein